MAEGIDPNLLDPLVQLLVDTGRVSIPLAPIERMVVGDPGPIKPYIDPIPTLEISIIKRDPKRCAVLLEFYHRGEYVQVWVDYTTAMSKNQLMHIGFYNLQRIRAQKDRAKQLRREKIKSIAERWLAHREFVEDCTCQAEPDAICWYHVNAEQQHKARVDSLVELLEAEL